MRKGMIYDLFSDLERVVFNLFIVKAKQRQIQMQKKKHLQKSYDMHIQFYDLVRNW
jgi:hypothetical protein